MAEVRDSGGRYAVSPQVARQVMQGSEAPLGEVPVPLGPRGLRAVGEVEGIHDDAPLPPPVARRDRPVARIRSVRDVAQPRSLDVNRIDVERQT
jgi:hypothetical protein